jgi:hypothetical protein
VPAVHDQALGADLGCRSRLVLEDLAAGDADPVVRRGDVHQVGRVHVEVEVGRLGSGAQGGRPTGVRDLGALPALRVTQEELREVGAARGRLGDRVLLVDVGADPQPG